MNGELIPAAVATVGGTSLLAGVVLHERAREERMRASRVRLSFRFPMGLGAKRAEAVVSSLSGLPFGSELVAEMVASEEKVSFALWVPKEFALSVRASLTGALPGLRIEEAEPIKGFAQFASRVFVPTPALLHVGDSEIAASALAGSVSNLREGERLVARWALRATTPRSWTPREPATPDSRSVDRAWRQKVASPGFRAAGLILVRASSRTRARELGQRVEHVVQSRHGATGRIRFTQARSGSGFASMPKTTRTSGWLSAAELTPLLGWPIGNEVPQGVEVGASRQVAVARSVPTRGRVLFTGRDSGGSRAVALSPAAARLHVLAVGPTGSGKSTVLARGTLDDIASRQAGLLLDPKSDLVAAVADRVAESDASRVVVINPADLDRPIGLDVFGAGDPDLRAETLTATLRGIYEPIGAWGVRSDYFIALGLRSLAVLESPSLLLFGRLFSDESFRRHVVAQLDDPVLQAAWADYEAMGAAERREHVAAPTNRIMALLQRPAVRGLVAQPKPKLRLSELWSDQSWALLDLSPGLLGEASSRLLGAIVSFVAWSTLEARAAVPESERLPVSLVFDELQALSALPLSVERLAERARGFNGRLTVGVQTLSRLPASLQNALLGNFATLICFRSGSGEARRLAAEIPGLTEHDLTSLQPYEVAARVATGHGAGVVTATGHTEPLPPPAGFGRALRRASAMRYGTPRAELEAAVRAALQEPAARPEGTRTGRARRES